MAKEADDKIFVCAVCDLDEKFDYFGREPPFTKPITFANDVYIMKDPFTSTEIVNNQDSSSSKSPISYLLLGFVCSICKNMVCNDKSDLTGITLSSLYYSLPVPYFIPDHFVSVALKREFGIFQKKYEKYAKNELVKKAGDS